MKKTLIVAAALFALVNLSGCVFLMPGAGYHADHGDLVSNDGTVHYIGWCDCLDRDSPANATASTLRPGS
jgi:hypothetical protein